MKYSMSNQSADRLLGAVIGQLLVTREERKPLKIKERCVCGALFEGSDPKGTFITSGCHPDENGDQYIIERALREFRAVHLPCLEKVQGRERPSGERGD